MRGVEGGGPARPSFLIVGAAKAGTSSLYHYLRQHPQVFMSPVKETNFFALGGRPASFTGPGDDEYINRDSISDPREYAAQFEGVTAELAVGEASPLYLYDPSAPVRIEKFLPAVKIVAILRHPVDRAYSSFLHMRRDGREPHERFADALAAEPDRIRRNWEFVWHYANVSRYHDQVARYLGRFGHERVLVHLYEDLLEDSAAVVMRTCRFVGVHDDFVPDVSRQYNRTGVPRSASLQRLMRGSGPAAGVVRALVPRPVRERLKAFVLRHNLAQPPLDEDLRADLVDRFRDDVLALQDLLDRDLSAWLR